MWSGYQLDISGSRPCDHVSDERNRRWLHFIHKGLHCSQQHTYNIATCLLAEPSLFCGVFLKAPFARSSKNLLRHHFFQVSPPRSRSKSLEIFNFRPLTSYLSMYVPCPLLKRPRISLEQQLDICFGCWLPIKLLW